MGGFIMYYFELSESYFLTREMPLPISLDQFQSYAFFYFLFVLWVNWLTKIYIIWFKSTNTFVKILAIEIDTIEVLLKSYLCLQIFVHVSNLEANTTFQYYYHSYDFFGRGYHFHTSHQLYQSNCVKSVLGNSYNPRLFLDEDNYLDSNKFLGFVWANRFEIGGKLTETQKLNFPVWINWFPEVSANLEDHFFFEIVKVVITYIKKEYAANIFLSLNPHLPTIKNIGIKTLSEKI
jgi:hypothetical protein